MEYLTSNFRYEHKGIIYHVRFSAPCDSDRAKGWKTHATVYRGDRSLISRVSKRSPSKSLAAQMVRTAVKEGL